MPDVVEVDRMVAGHDGVPAVADLSFTIAAGEVTALLGPNGAGKTTALLSLVGLLPLIDGRVTVLGTPVASLPTHELVRLGVGLVPDDRGLFGSLTVAEHFRLVDLPRGRSHADAVAAVLERFPVLSPLARLGGRTVGLLSGGEQQMLAIACAILAEPRVLMIDEMSLGLAPQIVAELLPAIADLAHERGVGVLLVEQHIDLALAVADHALVLNHGELVLSGPAAALRERRGEVVAAYFGAVGGHDT